MKIVVDSNIVFSGILNTKSSIGQIILEGAAEFDFYSIYQLIDEINTHKSKILKVTKYSSEKFLTIFEVFQNEINFINLNHISGKSMEKAKEMARDIDTDDTLFIALSLELGAKLWTGDKKLINGLRNKGFDLTVTTAELLKISNNFDNYDISTN